MRRIEAAVTIEADIQTVWAVIVTTSEYPKWNSFIPKVETNIDPPTVGTVMQFTVRWADGSTQKSGELVRVFNPPQPSESGLRAEWSYSFKSFLSTIGMVRAVRRQILTQTAEGHTQYETFEEFRGWGTAFLPYDKVQEGFNRQASALKARCESR
ncbi:MAG: SRPBCC domain-containing protein [Bacteroidota bacterium]